MIKKVEIKLSRTEWEGILRELGEFSVYYKLIKDKIKPRNNKIDLRKVGSKRTKRINSEKSWLTKVAESRRDYLVRHRTIYEKIAEQAIKELGLDYAIQKLFFYGTSFYVADIYLTKYKIILELDGRQHYDEKFMLKDAIRTENLLELGVKKVLRVANKDCTTTNIKQFLKKELE